jgi:hypothetical protein
MMVHQCIPVFLVIIVARVDASKFSGQFFSGTYGSVQGKNYLGLLDQARRMLSPADVEVMTISGLLFPTENALIEGAAWGGNIWTQNTFGFGLSAPPFLPDSTLQALSTSYLWWFDHRGDGGQGIGSHNNVPAGMLCDNGSPTGCNYMQCGPGRESKLVNRRGPSKLGDTQGPGKDWRLLLSPPVSL